LTLGILNEPDCTQSSANDAKKQNYRDQNLHLNVSSAQNQLPPEKFKNHIKKLDFNFFWDTKINNWIYF
jgi:hypothetical protein